MKTNSSWGKDTSFYRKKPWLDLRKQIIEEQPICQLCESYGTVVQTAFIDHILPRLIFPEYDLEPLNMQGLCERCHNQKGGITRSYKTKKAYLNEFDSGKLQYICTSEAKERLLNLLAKEHYSTN